MVVHQGSNPASLQPAGTCHFLLGSQQGWHETAGWPLRGGKGKKKIKKLHLESGREAAGEESAPLAIS